MQTQLNLNHVLAGLALILSLSYSATSSAALVNNGSGLIYDSGLNATWTQDANLLGTLEGNRSASYNAMVNTIITTIVEIQDTANIHDSTGTPGFHTLTTADFASGGIVNWFGAKAFVGYLNSIDYKGSTQWSLPTTPTNASNGTNPAVRGQLAELFYNELGGVAGIPIPSGPFSNVQSSGYWSGSEYVPDHGSAWLFTTNDGYQYSNPKNRQGSPAGYQFYAWAVSPGNVSAVPVPAAVWLFGSALAGFIGFNRRKPMHQAV